MYGMYSGKTAHTVIWRRCAGIPTTAPTAGGDGGVIIPYQLYMQYGDTRVIEENYDAMCRYNDYLVSTSTDYVRTVQQLGDWLSLEDTPTSLTNTAYCAYSSRLLSIMAEAIGKDEDAARFLQISENYKAAWNREFVLEDGSTVSDSQTSYAIGLVFDLFPGRAAGDGSAETGR